jgi:Peptidase propeptide and YPEB domain
MNAVRMSWAAGVALVLSAGGGSLGAHAAPPSPARAVVNRGPARGAARLSMDQAVRLAERRYRARVVRAETRTQGDRTIYLLRMLDGAGRVFSVQVDAASGTIS